MSRLDELIKDHCPNGVNYVALGEILDYEQPTKYLVSSTNYNSDYAVPVLTAGQTFILGYTDESNGIFPASVEAPVIIFDDFTTAFKWVDFPFKAKSSAMKMIQPSDMSQVVFKFVYYAMRCIRFEPSEHARHWISQYSQFRIPLPPLEVQREIVRVLDLFQELEAELEAELEVRKKQYEHYRDLFFSPTYEANSQLKTLGEIGSIFRGRRFVKDDIMESGIPAIHYGELYT
jgi:type I restriction enzyme S subunit